MKIVILADSVALPRPKGAGNIPYESTYPYILDRALRARLGNESPLLIERGMRSRTVTDVITDWHEEIDLKQADVAIVHVGGNDCAPRVFMPWERRVIEKLPMRKFRTNLLRWEKKYKRNLLLVMPNRCYVPLSQFKHKVEEIVKLAAHSKLKCVFFVDIMPVTERIIHHLLGVAKNVEQYNKVLGAQAKHSGVSVIDISELVRREGGLDKVTFDGMHYNEAGHRMLANELESRIFALVERESAGAGPRLKRATK